MRGRARGSAHQCDKPVSGVSSVGYVFSGVRVTRGGPRHTQEALRPGSLRQKVAEDFTETRVVPARNEVYYLVGREVETR